MFDRDTLIIGYDPLRGEARGSRPRSANAQALGLGDCIDCKLCVQVCPTGIDIRDGLQSNCIGCAACIDVCDSVMDKMNYPRGLIRYSTENGLQHGWDHVALLKRVLRIRVLVYGALLGLVTILFVASLQGRSPCKVDVIRDRGVMARVVQGGAVENVYRLHVMNTTESAQRYQVDVLGLPGLVMANRVDISLGPVEERTVPVSVRLPALQAAALTRQSLPIQFELTELAQEGRRATAARVRESSTFHLPH